MRIKKYKQSEIDKEVIFYEVEVSKKQEKIFLDKRYSEFNLLHKELKKLFEHLPAFPSKTLFNISKNSEELTKRKDMLDRYLKVHFELLWGFRISQKRKSSKDQKYSALNH